MCEYFEHAYGFAEQDRKICERITFERIYGNMDFWIGYPLDMSPEGIESTCDSLDMLEQVISLAELYKKKYDNDLDFGLDEAREVLEKKRDDFWDQLDRVIMSIRRFGEIPPSYDSEEFHRMVEREGGNSWPFLEMADESPLSAFV